MPNLGAESAGGGLRGNIMRTPGQRQQNVTLEGLINEAAASAEADPIQFRSCDRWSSVVCFAILTGGKPTAPTHGVGQER
jgi:hypothetical protein